MNNNSIISLLFEPFQYQFMLDAMLVAVIVATLCGLLSVFLILKGWSLIGDALSHSVVPGVAFAYWFGFSFIIGAFFSGLFAALSMLLLRQFTKLKEDVAIGFIFSAFFALGLLLISLNPVGISIQTIIMGSVFTVLNSELWQIIAMCTLVFAYLSVNWRTLMLILFDEFHARTLGINVALHKVIFFSMLSAAIVASLQAVGAILVIAIVIIPGASAFLLFDRFGMLLVFSALFGGIAAFFGTYFSYFLDIPAGPLVVSLQVIAFVLIFLFSPKYGLLKQNRVSPSKLRSTQNS